MRANLDFNPDFDFCFVVLFLNWDFNPEFDIIDSVLMTNDSNDK